MNEWTQKSIEKYETGKLGLDDTFEFHCTMCGKCCIRRNDILLKPSDLYQIAKELKMSVFDFFISYCEAYIGGDTNLPIVRLKPRGSVQRCPLLKERKCMVHQAKPSICALFPLGRTLRTESEETPAPDFSNVRTEYFFSNPGCGDKSETHTIREWLNSFHILEEDEIFKKWSCLLTKVSPALTCLKEKIDAEVMNTLWDAILFVLYLS